MAKPTIKQIAQTIVKSLDKPSPARHIAAYLVIERRTRDLAPIMREVMKIRGAQEGIIEAEAISAFPLAVETQQVINKLLLTQTPAAKHIILNKKQDAAAVGGVRVVADDFQLDLTVHGRLNHLKQLKLERN